MRTANNMILKAKDFATRAHGEIGQTRKYTGEPYIVHPKAVANIVSSVPHTDEMMVAAWLHDTVEDTNVKLEEIYRLFGAIVGNHVFYLTDVSSNFEGNRGFRKNLDLMHIKGADDDTKTIKVADLIHNAASILQFDKSFAKVYIPEKERLLVALKGADQVLLDQAHYIVNKAKQELNITKK